MSVLFKAGITLTAFLLAYYGYLKAEEDDFYQKAVESEDPYYAVDPLRLKIMRAVFVLLWITDLIILMICLWS